MTEAMSFLQTIEAFIDKHEMKPTQFGKLFAGDPLFVFQVRNGREPRSATRQRVLDAMREYQPVVEAAE